MKFMCGNSVFLSYFCNRNFLDMKRILLVLVTLLLISPFAISRQISEAEAFSVAVKYSSVIDAGGKCDKLKKAASGKSYYAFNAEGGGFIIVSGDDRLTELVGYSKEGKFDEADMPENMRYLLDGYSEYLSAVRSGKILPKKAKVSVNANVEVGPLLTTKWNQKEPYNKLAPSYGEGHCPTGCIATAMAQVMNFHKWPLKGTGSNSYSHSYGISTVDFSQSTYDWDNMLDGYYDNPSAVEVDAVAKLMYDAAVSVNMKWVPDVSRASNYVIASALREYFGYQSQFFYRDDFTTAGFKSFLKSEIDALRPIIYLGEGSVKHAFVADGYDSNDFVHINWGWGGHYDGFFDVSYLYPDGIGIGGGEDGYNLNQSIITVSPLKNGEKPYEPISLGFYNTSDLDVGISSSPAEGALGYVSFYVKSLQNQSDVPFSGDFALGIFNLEGEMVATSEIKSHSNRPMKAWSYAYGFYCPFPELSLQDGEYSVSGIFRLNPESKWEKMRTKYGMRMSVKSGKYSLVSNTGISLRAAAKPYLSGKPEVGRTISFVFPVINAGGLSAQPQFSFVLKEKGKEEIIEKGFVRAYLYDGVETDVKWKYTFSTDKVVEGKIYEVSISRIIFLGEDFTLANDFGPISFVLSAGDSYVEYIESDLVTVGPVPAEDVLYIKGASVSKVRVYSILGALVASEYYDNLSSVSIDVSALSPGAYVLDIETANGIVRKRFIKK